MRMVSVGFRAGPVRVPKFLACEAIHCNTSFTGRTQLARTPGIVLHSRLWSMALETSAQSKLNACSYASGNELRKKGSDKDIASFRT